jgi:hypothetical protein
MTEPIIDPALVDPALPAPVVDTVPADFVTATQPVDPAKAVKAKYVSNPVKQETVEVMQYVAPDGAQGGNIPGLQDFAGPDVAIVPQPSFNVATGQTCIHVDGKLTQPGDYVIKHADRKLEVLSEDALAAAYTAK